MAIHRIVLNNRETFLVDADEAAADNFLTLRPENPELRKFGEVWFLGKNEIEKIDALKIGMTITVFCGAYADAVECGVITQIELLEK